jgi:RecJ-like exonuclease
LVDQEECPDCDGTGHFNGSCPSCKGTGFVNPPQGVTAEFMLLVLDYMKWTVDDCDFKERPLLINRLNAMIDTLREAK